MKSPAEYQREYRERKRLADIANAKPDSEIFRKPFFEFFKERTDGFSDWTMYFDMAGLTAPEINDDSDPTSLYGKLEGYNSYEGYRRSIGRAEVMMSAMLDGAAELAGIINDYKQKEINDRIAEIEQSDLSNPMARKRALADIVRLKKMLDRLDKPVRWTFPQWRVTGE